MSVDEFYDAINESKPSFIRIEADELTYPLHVMVRYELEKELFDGTLSEGLTSTWNDKMEAYLGIRPENDAQGVCTGLVAHLDTSSYALGMHNLSKEC